MKTLTETQKVVHLVIESRTVEYHGSYREVIAAYNSLAEAQKRVSKLYENNKYDTEYYIDTFNIE